MLLGIHGNAQAGKDTIAEYIANLDNRFKICKFATGVREVVSILTGISPKNMLTLKEKSLPIYKMYTISQFENLIANGIKLIHNKELTQNYDMKETFKEICFFNNETIELRCSIGKLLQVIGGFFRNVINQDVWVNYLFKNFNEKYIVISDVRYPNEVQKIHDNNGIVLKITQSKEWKFPHDGRSYEHESENQILMIDFTIDNCGTLQDLYDKIDIFYAELLSK